MPKGRADGADEAFGRQLRQLREAVGLSQEDVADRLGITRQQYSKYEKGENRVSRGRLTELKRLLPDLSIEDEASARTDGLSEPPQTSFSAAAAPSTSIVSATPFHRTAAVLGALAEAFLQDLGEVIEGRAADGRRAASPKPRRPRRR